MERAAFCLGDLLAFRSTDGTDDGGCLFLVPVVVVTVTCVCVCACVCVVIRCLVSSACLVVSVVGRTRCEVCLLATPSSSLWLNLRVFFPNLQPRGARIHTHGMGNRRGRGCGRRLGGNAYGGLGLFRPDRARRRGTAAVAIAGTNCRVPRHFRLAPAHRLPHRSVASFLSGAGGWRFAWFPRDRLFVLPSSYFPRLSE